MLAISKKATTEVIRSPAPTFDNTAQEIENAGYTEQEKLRISVRNMIVCPFSFLTVFQVQKREDNRCAITGAFDRDLLTMLQDQGRPALSGLNLSLQAAHILPLSLNKFQTASEFVGLDILYLSNILTRPTARCCFSMGYATIMDRN